MRAVVVGCGTWGTVFARLLRDRGHEVELACRDADQAAAIRERGRNPRYATTVDLTGITAAADAGYEDADVVVLAVPSRVFGEVVRGLPGGAPVLGFTKGLDPATGGRLSTLVKGRQAFRDLKLLVDHRDHLADARRRQHTSSSWGGRSRPRRPL